jgi:hypothetical protein
VAFSLWISNSNLYLLSFANADTTWVEASHSFVPQKDTCTLQFGSDYRFYLDDVIISKR